MKIKIIILLGIFIFSQNLAQAVGSQEKLTRIAIASSDAVKYESRWLDNPPRLVLKFNTPNVYGQLLKDTFLDEGVIKNITVNYYPSFKASPDRKKIKFLTFWFSQKTYYKVWDSDNKIFIDFKNPEIDADSRQIEISNNVNIVYPDSKSRAADELLASVGRIYDAPVSNAVKNPFPKSLDFAWFLTFLLMAVYILWYRPKEWRALMDRLANPPQAASSAPSEKRKWWRHNLSPLKNNNIYVKLKSADSKTSLGFFPKDIGYGGLSFVCNRLKKLKGKLNLSIFMPGAIAPVEVEGNIAWQRNYWNLFRRQFGVSFVKPPERDWVHIHRYIEEQYAALKQ